MFAGVALPVLPGEESCLTRLLRKFGSGPGAYEGLWDLVRRTYRALGDGSVLPVTPKQMLEINRLVAALNPEGGRA
jgi:hypothetical protein